MSKTASLHLEVVGKSYMWKPMGYSSKSVVLDCSAVCFWYNALKDQGLLACMLYNTHVSSRLDRIRVI